jgi:hypothetical protein
LLLASIQKLEFLKVHSCSILASTLASRHQVCCCLTIDSHYPLVGPPACKHFKQKRPFF